MGLGVRICITALVLALHVAAIAWWGRLHVVRPSVPSAPLFVQARMLSGGGGGRPVAVPAPAMASPRSNPKSEALEGGQAPVSVASSLPKADDATQEAAAGGQRAPMPRSAPDLEQLQGLTFSGLPIRLRLIIDDLGQVRDVIVLSSSEAPEVTEAVSRVLAHTAFVPARRDAVDVATEMDIELFFGPGA
ncbi:MAG: hypothetical protein A2W72_16860 [Burkholderiales bacterium RIFCSPLOWO2_12_67_14]|nr:MAG: hypothetical protein A3I64_02480 [Burkholderiales bacterium RIFCSPLOWO2_02_FULL_67_64]OGB42755.1 MAG: hypothetical protein A2W72_16860 [Burkholderiales bacterium RIFCSPLOWO2_12_67_14]OGB51495.1 MAG: hypothetical protein A3E51_26260 [Burkholderiales bacterium RIFCSPHIGHO2_12_FULL_67_38]OGB94049.1 MAG: hypothetical protein A3G82_19155 [Burkholderiales bacterium RIFCSPLOWO2_12_FULL_67_210]